MSADFWAGYFSGAAGIVIGNPLDLIKVRVQAGITTSDNGFTAINPAGLPARERRLALVKGINTTFPEEGPGG